MKTYKGEKIEKTEQEMFKALEQIQNEWVEYGVKKKEPGYKNLEVTGTQIAHLANEGLFTEEMIKKFFVMFKSYEILNFRHRVVVPYIIGYSNNLEIMEYNVALLNKMGIKAERT